MTYRWYDLPKKEVLTVLQTDEEKGLERREAAQRLKEDGGNVIHPIKKAPIRGYFLQVVSDLTALLLLATAVLAVIFRRDMGAVTMLVLLVINYAAALFSYIRAQKSLEKMGYGAQPTAKVMRSGRLTVIDGEAMVQGDILYLSAGDIIPCDARILEAEGFRVLEGSLFEAEKAALKDDTFQRAGRLKPEEALNMVYASTVVVSGRCRAVAVATGPDTLVCKMGKNRPVAACHRLDAVKNLKKISSLLSVVLLVPVFVLTLTELFTGGRVIEVFLSALALAVSFMPEMYAAFAYLAISRGMVSALKGKQKKQKGVFIKNPLALPALGEVDCLLLPIESFCLERCSTLTEVFDGDEISKLYESRSSESVLRVLRYGVISTGLYGAERLIGFNKRGENVYTREQQALIDAAERCGIYNKSLEERYPVLDHREKGENGSLFETTLVHFRDQDVVVLRGEPEQVLARCGGYCRKGIIHEMNAYAKNELMGMARSFIKDNRMPVAVATKNSNYNTLLRIVDCQSDLIFEGFLAIEKPLLPGAAKEILRLRKAGIRVMAYSAEEREENRFLAASLGIAKEPEQIASGSKLTAMEEAIFRINLKNYTYFEGFSPARLKFAAEVLGEEYERKIGMMGRRLDDVYPMYAVSVGFSEEEGHRLGRVDEKEGDVHTPLYQKKNAEGGDGSCQALNYVSDVILPPEDLSGQGGINAVSAALKTARWIYRNIRIVLFYLIFSGSMRLTALLFGMGGQFPLTPVQMLFAGSIADFFAVVVMAFDRSEEDFAPFRNDRKYRTILLNLLPAVGLGMIFSCFTVFLGDGLVSGGLFLKEKMQCFCFLEILLWQTAFLTALLQSGRQAGEKIRVPGAYGVYILLLVLFVVLCFTFPAFGALFAVSSLGWKAGVMLFLLPVSFLLIAFSVRWGLQKRKK